MNPEKQNPEQENSEEELKKLYDRIEEIKKEAMEIDNIVSQSGDGNKMEDWARFGGGRLVKQIIDTNKLIKEIEEDSSILSEERITEIKVNFLKKQIKSFERLLSECKNFK